MNILGIWAHAEDGDCETVRPMKQSQNGVNLDIQVKFDIEGQGRSVHKTIGTLTKVFCIFSPNLVILAWTGPELSRGQASDWHTDRQLQILVHPCWIS